MGELSKSAGELGEKIASGILKTLGWKDGLSNITIECSNKDHINDKGNQRETHGDDKIFMYNSPFNDDTTTAVHVSVKYSSIKPKKEQGLKTEFNNHFNELQEIIECAQYSENINNLYQSFDSKKNLNHVGLLIWLNSFEQQEHDFISILENIQLKGDALYPVYLIDTARALFLQSVIDDVKLKLKDDNEFKFYFPRIGSNIKNEVDRTANYLPVELIVSDIIPIVIRSNGNPKELIIYANQKFSELTYEMLISYALNFANGLVSQIKIGMSSFDVLNDAQQANIVLNKFSTREEKISAFTFSKNIHNSIHSEE